MERGRNGVTEHQRNVHRADIAVIGAGVVGSACAHALVRGGSDVLLVDAATPAAGSSGACSGLIAVSTKKPGLSLDLAVASKALYPGIVADLGRPVEYRPSPTLILIEDPAHRAPLEKTQSAAAERGFRLDYLEAAEVRGREPGLEGPLVGALRCEDEQVVNPYLMNLALAGRAIALGARPFFGAVPQGIDIANGTITGIETSRGRIEAEQFVFAVGARSAALGALAGLDLRVVPRRGEIAVTVRVPNMIDHYIMTAGSMLAKNDPAGAAASADPLMRMGGGLGLHMTAEGQVAIGTTRAFAGYDRASTEEGLTAILTAALMRMPALSGVPVLRCFTGLRPHVPDGRPLIGRSRVLGNLLVATGHDGDGISLSVITARLIAELAAGRRPSLDLGEADPDRFLNAPKPDIEVA